VAQRRSPRMRVKAATLSKSLSHPISADMSSLRYGRFCDRSVDLIRVDHGTPVQGLTSRHELLAGLYRAASPYASTLGFAAWPPRRVSRRAPSGIAAYGIQEFERLHATASSNANGSPVTCLTRRFRASSDLTGRTDSGKRPIEPRTVVPFCAVFVCGRYRSGSG
jgi:hypothetical protein